MFSAISDKISKVIRDLRGLGRISEKNVADALSDIREALISADVNHEAADQFIKQVLESAIGQKVLEKILPEQQIVKTLHDELVALLGGEREDSKYTTKPLKIILSGLHGSGKTTTAGKLGLFLKTSGYHPVLVACDVYRPAASEQLQTIASMAGVGIYYESGARDAVKLAKNGLVYAKNNGYDAIIFDTAGRLHVDKPLLDELLSIVNVVVPDETLLVVDGALGQEAANVAKTFHDTVSISGIVLSKLDGDSRGGAALSMKHVTGVPIKFIGTGEKLSDFSIFHAKRMANRILGMGDVVSLVEKAQLQVDKREQEKLSNKIKRAEFDLNDFLTSLQQMKRLGPISGLISMLPGAGKLLTSGDDDKQLKKIEAIIQSMTIQERRKPAIINSFRRARIARGAGVQLKDINALLKQFDHMQKVMKGFKGEKGAKRMKDFASQFGINLRG